MRNTMAIAKREFGSLLQLADPVHPRDRRTSSPPATCSSRSCSSSGQADMRHFFGNMPLLFCFIVPFVTMRLIAEERREGTLELLLDDAGHRLAGRRSASSWPRSALMGVLLLLTLAVPDHRRVPRAARQGRRRRQLHRRAAHGRRLRRPSASWRRRSRATRSWRRWSPSSSASACSSCGALVARPAAVAGADRGGDVDRLRTSRTSRAGSSTRATSSTTCRSSSCCLLVAQTTLDSRRWR